MKRAIKDETQETISILLYLKNGMKYEIIATRKDHDYLENLLLEEGSEIEEEIENIEFT